MGWGGICRAGGGWVCVREQCECESVRGMGAKGGRGDRGWAPLWCVCKGGSPLCVCVQGRGRAQGCAGCVCKSL